MADERDAAYDWDYEEEEKSSNVLWGRILALGVALLLAFLLGRATAPEGADPDQLRQLRAEVADKNDEIADLESQLQAQATPTVAESPGATPSETGEPEGQNYEVRPGDTLTIIAERFYNDPRLDECIAEYNDITDPTLLRVGQTLFIPDQCF
jgi:nucleoid-associated protein YgaU